MSQQGTITSKHTLTVSGSDAAVTWTNRGINFLKKFAATWTWRADSGVPATEHELTARVDDTKFGSTNIVKLRIPVVRSPSVSGDVAGYTAVADVAGFSEIILTVNRHRLHNTSELTDRLGDMFYIAWNDSTVKACLTEGNRIS